MSIGRIHPTEHEIHAECSHPDCPWTFSTIVPGMAAKALMAHNAEEHQ